MGIETDDWFFVHPTRFLRPVYPSRPTIAWKRLLLIPEVQNWEGLPGVRTLAPTELEQIGRRVFRETRSAPVFSHDEPDANGTLKVEYLLSAIAVRLRAGGSESIVGVLGRPGTTGRLVFGELRRGEYQVLWDSPLFNALRLQLGFEDVDGDATKEIVIQSAYGLNGDASMLAIFDVKGRELTRQLYCEFDPLWGYDATGLTCSIVGYAHTLTDPVEGHRDVLVRERDADGGVNVHRYAIRNRRYVDIEKTPQR